MEKKQSFIVIRKTRQPNNSYLLQRGQCSCANQRAVYWLGPSLTAVASLQAASGGVAEEVAGVL
jgi:hypothetical protein